MKTLNLLAFDFGASSGRAILGEFDGERISTRAVHQFSNGPVDITGHLFWDVLRFLTEIKEGISRAANAANAPLAGIGIDTWGVDYGLLDASGQMLRVPSHYRDGRTAGMFEHAFSKMAKEEIFRYTGVAFQPFNTLFQLLSETVDHPGILAQAATMLLMPDLLSYFLTGIKAAEYTHASTTQLLDARKRAWCGEIIRAMGLSEGMFPSIQQPGVVRGPLLASISEEIHVQTMPVIGVASHDTASAVVAVPSQGGDHAYLSSGTWSLLGVEIPEPVINQKALRWNFTNEGGFGGTYRLLRNVMGLWILQECRREWEGEGSATGFDEMVDMARQSSPFLALIDPDDELFYSPGKMTDRIRRFCRETGQQVPQSKGEIVRLVLESLALKYRWVVERLEEVTGCRVELLYLVGGGVRNTLLNQFTANALDRPVVGGPSEATAVGNLLVQAEALGELHGIGEIRQVVRNSFPGSTFQPRDADAWKQAFDRFEQILRQ